MSPCLGCGGDRMEDVMRELAPGMPVPGRVNQSFAMPNGQNYKWLGLNSSITKRIDTVLRSWCGTPYMEGVQVRGAGVIVCNWWRRFSMQCIAMNIRQKSRHYSTDAGIHNLDAGFSTVRRLVENEWCRRCA